MRVHGRERGSVTVLMAGVIVVLGALIWWVGRTGGVLLDRSRAQTAADAAALAGAVQGEEAARSLATANGASVVSFNSSVSVDGGVDVQVDVVIHGVVATATAHYQPPPPPPVESTVPVESSIPAETTSVLPVSGRGG